MNKFSVKVAYCLFHHSNNPAFATVNVTEQDGKIKLTNIKLDEEQLLKDTRGGVVHDWTLANFRKNVRIAVSQLLKDPNGMKFPIRWNEDTCLECTFKSL